MGNDVIAEEYIPSSFHFESLSMNNTDITDCRELTTGIQKVRANFP
jgi:hypothetical protein